MSAAGAEEAQAMYDWARVNVAGDGNCFYRSLYEAAKFHTDPSVLVRMLGCFGAEIEQEEGEDVTNLTKQTKVEAKEEEDDFCAIGRFIITNSLRANSGEILDRLVGGVVSPYVVSKRYIQSLIEPFGVPDNTPIASLDPAILEGVQTGWETYLSEMSDGFQTAFKDVQYFPQTRGEFAERYACMISKDGEFTAELDINIINTILAPCNLIVHVLSTAGIPDGPRRVVNPEGFDPLYVILDREGAHYNFLVAPTVYARHMKLLKQLARYQPDKVFYTHDELFRPDSVREQDHPAVPVPTPSAIPPPSRRPTTLRKTPGNANNLNGRVKTQLANMGIPENSNMYANMYAAVKGELSIKKGGKRRATRKKRRV
jgi:hypothetical protein